MILLPYFFSRLTSLFRSASSTVQPEQPGDARPERQITPNSKREIPSATEPRPQSFIHSKNPPKLRAFSEFGFKPLSQMIANLVGPQYLVKPLLTQCSINWLIGDSGTCKSFLAIDLGLCLAHGIEFHGYKVNKGAVFYICGEGENGVGARIEAWRRSHDITDEGTPFFVSELPAQLLEEANVEAISSAVERLADDYDINPALIIVDTLSTNMGDGDESYNKDVNKLYELLNLHLKKRFNICILIVHHTGHNDKSRERGASALGNNADGRMLMKKENDYLSVACLKTKDSEKWGKLVFATKQFPLPDVKDSEGESTSSLVLEFVKHEEADKEPNQLGSSEKTVYDALVELHETKGEVVSSALSEKLAEHGNPSLRKNLSRTIESLISKQYVIKDDRGYLSPTPL